MDFRTERPVEWMTMDGLLEQNGAELTSCQVDPVQLENWARMIELPEGIEVIAENAFQEYNTGEVVGGMAHRALHPYEYLNSWEKQMRQRQFVKHKFPEGVNTPREKAEYLFRMEKKQRLLKLKLPGTVRTLAPAALPAFLEEIEVAQDNPTFQSIDGVLYSRDGKTLIRYPGYRDDEEYEIPEGVEHISPGAFYSAVIKKITVPGSVKELCSRCFENAIIGTVELAEGLSAIPKECFLGSKVESLKLPRSLRQIDDQAFKGVFGIKELTCESDELAIGVGIFSEGRFSGIDWWCWSEIPKAAFLNAQIDRLDVPEGVMRIGEYAFAGCYKTKSISLPKTLEEIGPHSFDEGATWSGPVTLPEHLYHYLYRLPACAQVNKKGKHELWPERRNKEFREEREVLLAQKAASESCLKKLNSLQVHKKRQLRSQIEQIEAQLDKG